MAHVVKKSETGNMPYLVALPSREFTLNLPKGPSRNKVL